MCPRPADPAIKNGLVRAATELFLRNGFAATSIDEICKSAGVTKGALFHHFKDKQALAHEVLCAWSAGGMAAYAGAPFHAEPDPMARVLGYVDFTIAISEHGPVGCLIGSLAQETSATHPRLRARCAGALADWGTNLATLLEDARRSGKGDFDSESVAKHFVVVFEGAQLMAKAQKSTAVVKEELGHFRRYLCQLLGIDDRSTRKRRKK